MNDITEDMKLESIKSMCSTIRKSESSLKQMTCKGANTVIIEKRLKVFRVGLAILEYTWYHVPLPYSLDECTAAYTVLMDLLPGFYEMYNKLKLGSSQRTLLQRRIKALEHVGVAFKEWIG